MPILEKRSITGNLDVNAPSQNGRNYIEIDAEGFVQSEQLYKVHKKENVHQKKRNLK